MGDALLADVVPPPATGPWHVQLRGVVETLVRELSKHPAAAEERERLQAEKRAYVAGLPDDRYPHVRAAAADLTDCDDEGAYYGFGIDLYVEGAQALLRRAKRGR
jgi:hypothetical protein